MKVVVDVVNSQKVKDLTEEIKRQEQEILKWNAAMKGSLPAQQAALQTNMTNAGTAIANARTEIASLQPAAAGAGHGLVQLSYAVDDIQYGFNAIVNNIPGIVMGLGGSAGIAGIAQIAAVAVNQLIKHWSELSAALQAAWEGGSAERLKVLAERATEAAEAFEKLAKAPNEFEAKGKGIFDKAVENEGAAKLQKELTDAMMAQGRAEPMPAVITEGFGVGEDIPGTPAWIMKKKFGRTEAQAKQEQYDATAKRAAGLIGQTGQPGEAGRAARDEINRMIKEIPGAFSEDFKKKFAESDPATIKEHEKEVEAQKAADKFGEQANKNQLEAIKEKEKADKEDADERHAWLADIKRNRIESLEDERTKVQESMKNDSQHMHELQKTASERGQILQGSRAATDYYQQGGSTKAQEALEKAQELRKKQTELLDSIDKEIKKERRLTVPR